LRGSDGYNYLQQGVTTQITGQCGSALVPFYDGLEGRAVRNLGPEVFSRVREICDSSRAFPNMYRG
jgi:hypothetical protein